MQRKTLLIHLAIAGCCAAMSCVRMRTLPAYRTKVPVSNALFARWAKGSIAGYFDMDTSALYVNSDDPAVTSAYRFYADGSVNCFSYRVEHAGLPERLNPDSNGYRGILYVRKSRLRLDLFTRTNGMGTMGRESLVPELHGDTLVIVMKRFDSRRIYVRTPLPGYARHFHSAW